MSKNAKSIFQIKLMILVFVLAASQWLWFILAPQGFKSAWSHNPWIAGLIREHDKVREKAKLMTLNYNFPDLTYFAQIVAGQAQPRQDLMEGYRFGKPYIFHTYYQKAAELFPDSDAAHHLLGFCEYYLGREDIAVTHFQKSIALNPNFFWSYYDLGVIYLKQGDRQRSAQMFRAALSLNNDMTLGVLSQRPFYIQIWRYIPEAQKIVTGNLEEGIQSARQGQGTVRIF